MIIHFCCVPTINLNYKGNCQIFFSFIKASRASSQLFTDFSTLTGFRHIQTCAPTVAAANITFAAIYCTNPTSLFLFSFLATSPRANRFRFFFFLLAYHIEVLVNETIMTTSLHSQGCRCFTSMAATPSPGGTDEPERALTSTALSSSSVRLLSSELF